MEGVIVDLSRIFDVFSQEVIVMLSAMLPVWELKGAIPMARAFGMDSLKAFVLCYIGSGIPVPLLLIFLRPVMDYLDRTKLFSRFSQWLKQRSLNKSSMVKRYSLLGLFVFVSIPLPTTGVWSGSIIAALLRLPLLPAMAAILAGNAVAGFLIVFVLHWV
ncbi:MAG: hypothetical protein PWP48_1459 [Clostridiales bacterium]|jgi:uncharacterized membrane protein|nr:hypothetical protein [Clostridiales bacterium]